jgi:beta-lactamase class A
MATLAVLPLAACAPGTGGAAPATSAATGPAASGSPTASADSTPAPGPTASDPRFAALEAEFDARLGVVATDTGTGKTVVYRPDERFAYASTHKALTAALVLRSRTLAELDAPVAYTAADLVSHSPVTELHVDTGMSLREVCEAAVRFSDNTAANLLYRELGGPEAVEAALAAVGDTVTQVDRTETALNEAVPGDPRDTSTPAALAADLQRFALGDALGAGASGDAKRAVLADWMAGNATGDMLIRAGVPAGWSVGDKSGTASYGTRNDIAVATPPSGAPIVIAVMSSRGTADADTDDALIAEAARVAIDALRR